MLLPKNYHIETVYDRLHDLLESQAIAENCRRRAAGLASNTALERTCDLIEQLASSGNWLRHSPGPAMFSMGYG